MWYKVDSNGYGWKELLELYKIIDQRERGLREDLFRFTNFYSAVCYAILAFTLSGVLSLYGKGTIVLFLILGPMLTLCMCFLGLRVTRRIYMRIMAELSVKIKLENILGMDQALPVNQFLGKEKMWEEDDALISPRQAQKRRLDKGSKDFIDSTAKTGFYSDNRLFFGLMGIFSFLVGIAIIVISTVH